MTRREWIIFGLCVAIWSACAVLWVTRVEAQPICAPSISVILGLDRLGETELESLTIPATDGSGDVQWIMWLNEATGSWTLTATRGSMTCIMAGAHSGYSGHRIGDFLYGPAL